MAMPGRSYQSSSSYRYGMNGQEKDLEIFEGAMTAEFWEYDSRLGRRWNRDPITYPWQSSYATFNNNPVYFSDPSGLEGEPKANPGDGKGKKGDSAPNGGSKNGDGTVNDGQQICISCGDNGESIYGLPNEPGQVNPPPSSKGSTPDLPSVATGNLIPIPYIPSSPQAGFKIESFELDASWGAGGSIALKRIALDDDAPNVFRGKAFTEKEGDVIFSGGGFGLSYNFGVGSMKIGLWENPQTFYESQNDIDFSGQYGLVQVITNIGDPTQENSFSYSMLGFGPGFSYKGKEPILKVLKNPITISSGWNKSYMGLPNLSLKDSAIFASDYPKDSLSQKVLSRYAKSKKKK